MNLPFHASAGGSHSSMLISESDVGLRTICTRQCAGSVGAGAGAAAARAPGTAPRGAAVAPRAAPAGPRPAAATTTARRDRTFGNHDRAGDGRIIELEGGETLARRGRGSGGEQHGSDR